MIARLIYVALLAIIGLVLIQRAAQVSNLQVSPAQDGSELIPTAPPARVADHAAKRDLSARPPAGEKPWHHKTGTPASELITERGAGTRAVNQRGDIRAAHHWHHAVASYYGTDGTTGGCGHANGPRTFASLIVRCGARVKFCRHHHCVTGRRTDSGPYVAGRQFDLSTEMARRLRMTSAGVVRLKWRRVR